MYLKYALTRNTTMHSLLHNQWPTVSLSLVQYKKRERGVNKAVESKIYCVHLDVRLGNEQRFIALLTGPLLRTYFLVVRVFIGIGTKLSIHSTLSNAFILSSSDMSFNYKYQMKA